MVGVHRAGEDGRLGRRRRRSGINAEAGRLRVRPGLSDARRDADDAYNAAAWLRRSPHRGGARRARSPFECDGVSTDVRRAADRAVPGAARADRSSASAPGERVALVLNDEPGVPRLVPRRACGRVWCRCRCRRCSTAARAGGDRRRRRRPGDRGVGGVRRLDATTIARCRRRESASRGRRSAPRRRPAPTEPMSRWPRGRRSPTAAERRCRGDHGRLSRLLAVQQRARPARPRASCTVHGSPQATAETYARRRAAIGHRGRPLPVGGQAVLRLRPRQLADVPVRRRRNRDPRPPAALRRPCSSSWSHRTARRCSSPAPASWPRCSTPTRRPRRSRRCERR